MNQKLIAITLIFLIFAGVAGLGVIYIFDPNIMIGDKTVKEWICTLFPNYLSTIEGLNIWTRWIAIINTIVDWLNSIKPPVIPPIPHPNITPPPEAEVDVWVSVTVLFLVTKTETELGCNIYSVPTGSGAIMVYEFYSEKRCFIEPDDVAIQIHASTTSPDLSGYEQLTNNCWRKAEVYGGDYLDTATLDIQIWITKVGRSGSEDIASVVTRVDAKHGEQGKVELVVKTKVGALETASFKADVCVKCMEHYSRYKAQKQEYWACIFGVWVKTGEQWVPTEMTEKGLRDLGKVFESSVEVAL